MNDVFVKVEILWALTVSCCYEVLEAWIFSLYAKVLKLFTVACKETLHLGILPYKMAIF